MEKHSRQEKIEALGRVIDVLDTLRVKCPWDAKQTNESLRPNTVEEVYELCDALIKNDNAEIKKELGDVLLHVLFYARIGEDKEEFDVVDVCDALTAKLIYRHPHVYGNVDADNAHQVEMNWEQLKLKERDGNRSILAGVPSALPALVKAYRIQEKAANAGLDGEKPERVWEKERRRLASLPLKRRATTRQQRRRIPTSTNAWSRKWATLSSRSSTLPASTRSIPKTLLNSPTRSLSNASTILKAR